MADVLMHGPAFNESGKIVERKVPEFDVVAYQKAGYKLGGIPKDEPKKEEKVAESAVTEVVEEKPKAKRVKKAK